MEFPPVWEVLPNDAFLGYDATTPGGEFGAALLVQMREDGSVVDHFRINIFGDRLGSLTSQRLKAFTPFSSVRPQMRSRIWDAWLQISSTSSSPSWKGTSSSQMWASSRLKQRNSERSSAAKETCSKLLALASDGRWVLILPATQNWSSRLCRCPRNSFYLGTTWTTWLQS
jgi:hypothetical protein